MTREEILLAALANANGQNPVELAKQMQEFLDGEPKPQPKQSTIADYEAAMKRTEEVMQHIAEAKNDPLDEFYIDPNRVPDNWTLEWKTIPKEQVKMILHAREAENKKPKRNRAIWGQEELHQLDQMLTVGSSFKEIAINLDRSEKALRASYARLPQAIRLGAARMRLNDGAGSFRRRTHPTPEDH